MSFLRIRTRPDEFRARMRAAAAGGRARIVPAIRVEVDRVAAGARASWPSLSGRSAASIEAVDTEGGGRVDSSVPYTAWVRPRGESTTTAWDRYVVGPMRVAYDRLVTRTLPAIVRELLR